MSKDTYFQTIYYYFLINNLEQNWIKNEKSLNSLLIIYPILTYSLLFYSILPYIYPFL